MATVPVEIGPGVADPKAGVAVTVTAIGDNNVKDRYTVGEIFETNAYLKSANGEYKLTLQTDGNFVLSNSKGKTLWDSRSEYDEHNAAKGFLQDNGNLRLFDSDNREVWSSRTGGRGNKTSVLILQDDGNVVIHSDGQEIWATNTKQIPEAEKPKPKEWELPKPEGPARNSIKAGEQLNVNQGLTSANREFVLIMQGDSNLVLYSLKTKGPIWARGSGAGNTAQKLNFRNDGELELLTWSGSAKWAAGTPGRGNSNSTFQVRDDGNMVINTNNEVTWSSQTGPEIPIAKRDRLTGGNRLVGGEMLTSPNGKFSLILQADGNFVLYEKNGSENKAKWAAGTPSLDGNNSWVQVNHEGHMEIFAGGRLHWSTPTRYRRSGGDTVLVIQDDGAALLKLDGVVVWCVNGGSVQTYEPRDFEPFASGNRIGVGQCLLVGRSLTSKNGKLSALLQENGQFVVRANDSKAALYSSGPPSSIKATKLTNGYNDDLIIWGANGAKIWQNTSNRDGRPKFGDRDEQNKEEERERFFNPPPAGTLELDDTGCASLYGNGWPNDAVWGTGTNFPAFKRTVSQLKPGESLLMGQKMLSDNGDHEFSLLPTGHFQIRNTRFGSIKYFYAASTAVQDANSLFFHRDEMDMVIRGQDGREIWRSVNPRHQRQREREREYQRHAESGDYESRELYRRYQQERAQRESYERERFGRREEPPRFILDDDANVYLRNGDDSWSIRSLESGTQPR